MNAEGDRDVDGDVRTGRADKAEVVQVRNCYFKAIRLARNDYWNNLFKITQPNGIWKILERGRPQPAASLPELANTTTFDESCLALRIPFVPLTPQIILVT